MSDKKWTVKLLDLRLFSSWTSFFPQVNRSWIDNRGIRQPSTSRHAFRGKNQPKLLLPICSLTFIEAFIETFWTPTESDRINCVTAWVISRLVVSQICRWFSPIVSGIIMKITWQFKLPLAAPSRKADWQSLYQTQLVSWILEKRGHSKKFDWRYRSWYRIKKKSFSGIVYLTKELCLGNHFWAQSIFGAQILFESLVWLVISTHLKNIYWSNWIISPILRGENKINFETTYQVIPKISGVELNFLEIGDVPTHPTFYRDSLGILVAAPLGWGGDPRFPSTSTWSLTWRSERWHVRLKLVRWVERSDHHPRCPGDMREEGCVKNACWPVGLVLLKNYCTSESFLEINPKR